MKNKIVIHEAFKIFAWLFRRKKPVAAALLFCFHEYHLKDATVGILKNHTELKAIREAGKITAFVLNKLFCACQPGVSTLELEALANRLLAQSRSTAPFKRYEGFNHAICISFNDEIVNAPPSRERILKEGDLVSIATAAEQRGIHAKAARTFYLGETPPENIQRLLTGTSEAIARVAAASKTCATLNEILAEIPKTAEAYGLTILEKLGGAGIGKHLHEDPWIPNMPEELDETISLRPGFACVVMPMFSLGENAGVIKHSDGWTYLTQDGAVSAHFADTLLMTEEGFINLTHP